MLPCEHSQQQLLPFLYDLLEPQERQELANHVETCAMCQEALHFAKQQRGLLAEAVKEEHTDIVFKAPVKVSQASTQPTVALAPARRRPFYLNRWAMAASLLFVLFSAGGALGWTLWQHQAEQRESAASRLAKAKEQLQKTENDLKLDKDRTQKEINAIQEQIEALFVDWRKEESQAPKEVKGNKQVSMQQWKFEGPQVAQAGAPNTYVGVMQQSPTFSNTFQGPAGLDKFGKPQAAIAQDAMNIQGNARIIDQTTKKVLQEQKFNLRGQEKLNVVLPRDLQIKPDSDLAIDIEYMLQGEDGKPILQRDKLKLVFPEYVTHLATDRPMYRPGETVRFRSLTLERFSLKPAQETFHLLFRILGPNNSEIFKKEAASELISAKDKQPVKGPDGQPVRGMGVGEFTLPDNLPDGQYRLLVSEVNERFNEEKRTFLVHRRQPPRFHKEVQFQRPSYRTGDLVKVNVRVIPLPGVVAPGVRAGIALSARFDVDGATIRQQNGATDNDGRCTFECELPAQLFKGVGTVTIDCNDGGKSESIVRAIPLTVQDLRIDFFPEGGDLIAGVPNRVYFQVTTPAEKPADIEGRLVDDTGKEITQVKTLTDANEPGINQGLGSFTFTPQANRIYQLLIDTPIGFDRQHTLNPGVKKEGVVLHLRQDVVESEIPLTLYNRGSQRDLLIGAYCRGRLLGHAVVTAKPGQAIPVTLQPFANVGGVYRITVFEKQLKKGEISYRPLAERLIYRKNTARVDVEVASNKKVYQPGDHVTLSLQARNEAQQPVPALALMAVVDSRLLKLADEKTARLMPTHFLLTTEIRNPDDLENADVLLGNHPKAAQALDLLLGCQGWRRFAEQDPVKFWHKQATTRMPAFLANSNQVTQFLDADQKQLAKLDEAFVTKAIDLEKKLAEKEKKEDVPPPLQQQFDAKEAELQASFNEVNQAEQRLRELRAFMIQFALGGVLLMLLLAGFFLVQVGLQRLSDGRPARPWFVAGFGLLALLFLGSIIGTFTLMGMDHEDFGGNRFNGRPPKVMQNIGPPAGAGVKQEPLPLPAPVLKEESEDERNIASDLLEIADAKQTDPAMNGRGKKQAAFANQQGMLALNRNLEKLALPVDKAADRTLRQQGNYQALLQRRLGRRVQMPPAQEVCVVREYAPMRKPKNDETQADLAETIYWHPVLVLPGGKGEIQFDLPDAVTRYEVLVLSHTLDGRLGANRSEITAKLPFTIDPSVPLEVTSNDQIGIPVMVNNDLNKKTSGTLSASVKGLKVLNNAQRGLSLAANEKQQELFKVTPTTNEGKASVRFTGKTANNSEAVECRVQVVPDGFPVTGSVSGVLAKSVDQQITLPANWIDGTLKVQAHFYPTPLAELQSGLEALLREPSGCFEQSSSSNYSNVMILNYLKQTNQANPVVEKRTRQLLQAGNEKMASFQYVDPGKTADKRGYNWFKNSSQPDEALTAYGLLQLHDLAKVQRVDKEMLRGTENYLLQELDYPVGSKSKIKAVDYFDRVPEPITTAYLVWALTESKITEKLDKELQTLRAQSKTRKDPYFLALVGLSHLNTKKTQQGIELLKEVRAFQRKDGQVEGAATSITGSQGHDLLVETTALALLGWLRADRPDEFAPNLKAAYLWLNQQRQGKGNFGATQATILALKALVAYAEKNPIHLQNGEVQMIVARPPGQPPAPINQFQQKAAQPGGNLPEQYRAPISPRSQEALTLTLSEPAILQPGKNVIQLSITNNNSLPYTLTWSYRMRKPVNDPKAPVRLSAKLNKERAKQGETVKLTATVENVSGKGQGMTVAILGLPSGLALPDKATQLEGYANAQNKDANSGKIGAWELRGRELILTWRDLAPDAKIVIELDLTCHLSGQYRGPASRAYLYYDADRKYWIEPLNIQIVESTGLPQAAK